MNGKTRVTGKTPLVTCSENPVTSILMRVSLPSKLRKTKTNQNKQTKGRERQRELHTRTYTLTHAHNYTHYCSTLVGSGRGQEPTYSTAYLQPRKVEIDSSQVTAKYGYCLSFIPFGCLQPSLSIKCDSLSLLSFTLNNRLHFWTVPFGLPFFSQS